jgi:pSer/pThr/pTyr-binding forkhead associated (FHA) protein
VKLIVLKNNVPLSDVVVDTDDASERYEIFVGRSEDCHVRIDDPLISRHHFLLKNEDGGWYCEKLSKLGVVTVNGGVVTRNRVANGDELKCGAYSIILTGLAPAGVSAAAAPPFAPKVYDLGPSPEDYDDGLAAAVDEPSITAPLDLGAAVDAAPALEDGDALSLDAASGDDRPADDLGSFDDLSGDLGGDLDGELGDLGSGDLAGDAGESDPGFGGDLAEATDFADADAGDGGGFDAPATTDQNESTRFFKAFVNYQLILFGDHAPYDRYFIDADEVFVGRDGKKCQIVLNDPEVSSVHAVLRKVNTEITLEDLNSSNGTILNGERINRAQLSAGDEFVIGGTSFTLEVRSDLLDSEADRLMPVEKNQVVETEEVVEEEIAADGDLSFEGEAPPEKSLFKRMQKDPAFRKKAIYAIAALLAVVFLLPGEEEAEAPKKAKVAKEAPKADPKTGKPKLNLSKELENARNVSYELGVSYFEQSRYDLAQVEFQKVVAIDPEYKKVQSYLEQTKVGLKRLEELEAERRAEEERIKTKKLVDELLVKARDAVKERQVPVAESLFSQITEKDPENMEVMQLKLELETWQKEEERKALELAAKEAARKRMIDALTPGKTQYLKKEWFLAINRLEEFLRLKNTDEDLIKEASDMLSDAKNQLASELGPVLGKARSLKEGQDLKAAYEAYQDVLKMESTNREALNEVDEIKSLLDARSKKIYREAIIAESLSLFTDAKEKFQEVQQISPTDSEYYKKASEKLKNYLE